MIKRLFFAAFVVGINIAVLAFGVAAVEIGFRLSDGSPRNDGPAPQWLEFTPYVMFANGYGPAGDYQWDDQFRHRKIPAKVVSNHLGFPMRDEFDFARMRPKQGNERVILLTGGSAAWGVGATSNETTIAGRMQAILNEAQSSYHYSVFNLAMGGWVSVQQFIALAMYGRNLQPDWLVGMDGTNDVAVACAHSQGAGSVMHYGLMEAYMKAYVFGQIRPEFYRSRLENQLIKHSVAYRKLTGKTPVEFNVLLEPRDPGVGRIVIRPTTWNDVERQLELYIQTEGEMIDLFPHAKVILSTQPLPFDFENMFGRIYQTRGTPEEIAARTDLTKKLNDLRAASKDQRCGLDLWNNARDWFMPSSALRLEALVMQYQSAGRDAHYANVGTLFPDLLTDRDAFFIDPVHLNDTGMDIVARYYSGVILASDLPDRFANPRWAGQSLPAVPGPH